MKHFVPRRHLPIMGLVGIAGLVAPAAVFAASTTHSASALPASAATTTSTVPAGAPEPLPLDIAAARAGLAVIAAVNAAGDGSDVPCATLPLESVDATLASVLGPVGISATLQEFGGPSGPNETSGLEGVPTVVCGGAFVPVDPEVTTLGMQIVVLDFGETAAFEEFKASMGDISMEPAELLTVGGQTLGSCENIEVLTQCMEVWESDGLAVIVNIDQVAPFDRTLSVAFMDALVPQIVANLAGGQAGAAGAGATTIAADPAAAGPSTTVAGDAPFVMEAPATAPEPVWNTTG